MYIDNFNLQARPFAIVPDPDFLVWTAQHRAAFKELLRASAPAQKATLLTGEVGCGKSTLIQALIKSPEVEEHRRVVLISNRLNSAAEVSQQFLMGLEQEWSGQPPDALPNLVTNELARSAASGMMPLIIIDEAQSMADEAALMVARLVKAGRDKHLPCSLILSGQPELDELIERHSMTPLRDLISHRVHVGRLGEAEIVGYIEGRLKCAGYVGEELFTDGAISEIYAYSRGTPRLINKVCDLAMFTAAKQNLKTIDQQFIREVVQQWEPLGGAKITTALPAQERAQTTPVEPPEKSAASTVTPFPVQKKSPPTEAPIAPATADDTQAIVVDLPTEEAPAPPELAEAPQETAPRRRRLPLRLLGGLTAAACAVPALLLLNAVDDPASPPDPAPSNAVGEPVAAADSNTVPKEASVLAIPPGGTADTADSTAEELARMAERELAELNSAIEAARAERERVEAQLALQLQELAQTSSAVETASAATAAEMPSTAQPELIAAAEAPGQSAEIPVVATDNDAAEAPQELVSRAAVQLVAPEKVMDVVTENAAMTSTAVQLAPLHINDDPAPYYLAALGSTEPAEMAVNYARAALRGHPRAAEYLGQLFDTGDGLVLAAEMAQRWYAVAKDSGQLSAPEFDHSPIAAGQQSVQPLAAIAREDVAEFIWDGAAGTFSVEIADQNEQIIAYAVSPLTALCVKLPEDAAYWRVTTDAGASFAWQSIVLQ